MEAIILDLSQKGQTDEEIADHLTALGYRSPMCTDAVLPSTVMNIRLKHGIFLVRSQSHPRRIPGYLTLTQVARALDQVLEEKIVGALLAVSELQLQLVQVESGVAIDIRVRGRRLLLGFR